MEENDSIDVELSIWWGVATLVLIVGGSAVLVAQNLGPEAVKTLLYTSLMLVFLVGGVLLGALATQALGSGQRWGFADDQPSAFLDTPSQEKTRLTSLDSGGSETISPQEEDGIDPFYEILKRNRAAKKAA